MLFSGSEIRKREDETPLAPRGGGKETMDGIITILCAAAMTFPDAVYEEINEIALEALGDILIDTAEGAVYEEYRGVLE